MIKQCAFHAAQTLDKVTGVEGLRYRRNGECPDFGHPSSLWTKISLLWRQRVKSAYGECSGACEMCALGSKCIHESPLPSKIAVYSMRLEAPVNPL